MDILWEMNSERNVSMQTITRHVETGELGQQVSNPLPGYHVTVWKNTMRQFLTQLSSFTQSLHQCSDIISPVRQDFNFFLFFMSRVRLHERKLNICWERFLIILMQWITCITAVNLCFLVEMGTTQTQRILAQIKNGSWANFLLHTLFLFSHQAPNTWYAASRAPEW